MLYTARSVTCSVTAHAAAATGTTAATNSHVTTDTVTASVAVHCVYHYQIGTFRYMSPERLRGEDYGPAADIWSLGLVLLELATRQVYSILYITITCHRIIQRNDKHTSCDRTLQWRAMY
jgi:serine/threonine protein kinase